MKWLFLCSLLIYLCNGQDCTSPVYNNFAGAIIRGPCPSSQVVAPVGSTIKFKCSFDASGYTQFWNVSGLIFVTNFQEPPNTNVSFITNAASGSGSTVLTVPVESQYLAQLLNIQCGLCNLNSACTPSNLQDKFGTIPVQLIGFGKSLFIFS